MKTVSCPKCKGSGVVTDQTALGLELRALRLKASISLRDMARWMRITPPFLSDMELGKRNWKPARESEFRLFCRHTNNKKKG